MLLKITNLRQSCPPCWKLAESWTAGLNHGTAHLHEVLGGMAETERYSHKSTGPGGSWSRRIAWDGVRPLLKSKLPEISTKCSEFYAPSMPRVCFSCLLRTCKGGQLRLHCSSHHGCTGMATKHLGLWDATSLFAKVSQVLGFPRFTFQAESAQAA